MDGKEFQDKMSHYQEGTVISFRWDRGNGELERDMVYLGIDCDGPILVPYEEGRKIQDYEEKNRFDLNIDGLQIFTPSVSSHKSLDMLE